MRHVTIEIEFRRGYQNVSYWPKPVVFEYTGLSSVEIRYDSPSYDEPFWLPPLSRQWVKHTVEVWKAYGQNAAQNRCNAQPNFLEKYVIVPFNKFSYRAGVGEEDLV